VDADVVVSLTTRRGDGVTRMVLLAGEARFAVAGGLRPVRYTSGERLNCLVGSSLHRQSDVERKVRANALPDA
jgi:hypothetical protein